MSLADSTTLALRIPFGTQQLQQAISLLQQQPAAAKQQPPPQLTSRPVDGGSFCRAPPSYSLPSSG